MSTKKAKPVIPGPVRTKVAIVGFADTTRDMAPYKDPDFEVWGLNDLFEVMPRCDRLFQIHSRKNVNEHTTRTEGKSYPERLRELSCPIYMVHHFQDIPNSVRYPLRDVIAALGGRIVDYFTNTLSYEVALAIVEGFREIHLYGVDMAVGTEYAHQRPSCEFFLGIAVGRGIKVYVPPQSDLLKTRFRYGFQDERIAAWNAMCAASSAMMRKRAGEAQAQEAALTETILMYEGAIRAVNETALPMLAIVDDPGKRAAAEAKLKGSLEGMAGRHREACGQREQAKQFRWASEGAMRAVEEMDKRWQ